MSFAEPAAQNLRSKYSPYASCCDAPFVSDVETTKVGLGDLRNLHEA